MIVAQYTLATDQNTLKNLLTDQYARWHDMDIQPTATITNAPLQLFDVQDSWSKGMTMRPDLLQARLDVEKQGIQLKFDRNQLFPELDLIGTYGFNGTGTEYSDAFNQYHAGDRPFYSYGAQISVPLSNAKARNTAKSDKATLQQLLLTLKQFEQNVMVQIDNAVKQAQSDCESVKATRQARIYAEAALDAEQKKYAVGKSTTFTVLQLQNTLTADRGAGNSLAGQLLQSARQPRTAGRQHAEAQSYQHRSEVIQGKGWHFAGPQFRDGDTPSLPGIRQPRWRGEAAQYKLSLKPDRAFVLLSGNRIPRHKIALAGRYKLIQYLRSVNHCKKLCSTNPLQLFVSVPRF